VVPGPAHLCVLWWRPSSQNGRRDDVAETLEAIPRSWKVVQTVQEKFTCRDCEAINQPPAPFHLIPRSWVGPSLLAILGCRRV